MPTTYIKPPPHLRRHELLIRQHERAIAGEAIVQPLFKPAFDGYGPCVEPIPFRGEQGELLKANGLTVLTAGQVGRVYRDVNPFQAVKLWIEALGDSVGPSELAAICFYFALYQPKGFSGGGRGGDPDFDDAL